MNTTLLCVVLGVACAFLTVVAYLPAMEGGFYLDDTTNIVAVKALHWQGWGVDEIHHALTETQLPTRPLANISFALNHLVGGMEPYGYHLTNLVIHLITGISLFWVAILMAREGRACDEEKYKVVICSLAITMLYLVHPLNTQAVTYVVQRMTLLSALFILLSFGFYLLARRSRGGRKLIGFSVSALCWLLALASKEVALQFPLVLLIYEVVFHRGCWKKKLNKYIEIRAFNPRVLLISGILILMLMVILEAYNVQGKFIWHAQVPDMEFTGAERMLTQFRVQFFYLSLVFMPLPSRLNLDHDFIVSHSFWQPWTTAIAVSGWVVALMALILLAKSRPRLAFPLLAYLSFHLLESGPVRLEMVFEHRMYLPMAFLALFLNSVLLRNLINWKASVLVVYLLALPLAYATHERNQVWSNEIEFWQDSADKSPNKLRPWYYWGTALLNSGRLAEAEEVFNAALKLPPKSATPTHAWVHNQLGNVYNLNGKKVEAVEQYKKALGVDPALSSAKRNLLNTLRGYKPKL